MDISDITMFITKMNEAFGLITESFREMAEALNKLFVCFGENEEEEKNFCFFDQTSVEYFRKTFIKSTQNRSTSHRSYKLRDIWHIK